MSRQRSVIRTRTSGRPGGVMRRDSSPAAARRASHVVAARDPAMVRAMADDNGTGDSRRRARAALAHDASRAGARAHFRAMGIDPARLDGPVVGIASTWTGTMPCNITQRELAAH